MESDKECTDNTFAKKKENEELLQSLNLEVDVEEEEPNKPVIAGVEENVHSRFVDYTKATPWEHLISDIERGIKSLFQDFVKDRIEIEYADRKYSLCLVNKKKAAVSSSYLAKSDIYLWFDVSKYLIFCHNGSALTDASQRRVLFSALIAALDISRQDIPIFLSSEPLGYVRHAKEVLGYHIVSPRINEHDAGNDLSSHPAVGHFESSMLPNVTRKHALYYLDGLSRLFGAKLWKFSCGSINVSEETVIMSAWETYDYQPQYFGSEHTPNNKKPVLSNQGSFSLKPALVPSISDGIGWRMPSSLQSTLEDLQACFPDTVDPYSLSPSEVPLWKLSIQLHFAGMKQSATVDNDYYTTLLPSKLPPAAFSASAEFSGTYKSPSTPTAHELMSEPSMMPIYSSSLRRLLAMYICGKSCKPGHTFRSLSGKDGPVTVLNTDKAINISTILSTDTRRAVVAMCAAIGMGPESLQSAAPVSLPQDLLMRVFSRSLWVDSADHIQGNKDILYEDYFAEDGICENISGSDDDDETGFFDCASSPAPSPAASSRQSEYSGRRRQHLVPKSSSADSLGGNNKERSGKFVLPWKWLCGSEIVASPVGSWFSLVSVYVSSLKDIRSMTSFWVECVEEVRVHWESRVPIPRLFPPTPIAPLSTQVSVPAGPVAVERKDSGTLRGTLRRGGMWLDPLWSDVTDKWRSSATPFMLPDVSQCLPFQKLQMINMSIICSEESTIIDDELVGKIVKDHRNISFERKLRRTKSDENALSDLLASAPPLSPMRLRSHVSTTSTDAEGRGESAESGEGMGRNLLDDLTQEYDANSSEPFGEEPLRPVEVDFERDISKLKNPRLRRRLPMMTDTWAQHKRLTQKIHNGESRTINDNPMLRWQISMPALLSDIRSFKDCNPDATLDDFLTWYGGVDRRIDLRSMEEIWNFSPPMSAEEQKPLFKAEQEAEKALGYLEGLSLAQLAAVLLTSAMTSFHMMLSSDIKVRCSHKRQKPNSPPLSDFSTEDFLQEDLNALEILIIQAAELIEQDTSMFGTTNHSETSVSQKTLLAIDAVCEAMFHLEILQLKMKACEETLHPHERLIATLSRHGTTTAATPQEAKHLLSLAKSASFGGDSHTWHSYDGRELGLPSRKVFDLRCAAESALVWLVPLDPTDDKVSMDHCMRAVLENDELRVAFKLYESDGVM